MNNDKRIEQIIERLQSLNPNQLSVIDDSAKHIGHAGAQTGMGHFTLNIAASSFKGKSDISIHRLIYQALGDLMQTDIHALSINIVR